ncbi:MAG: septum formation initiator family protein [Alphaproteobacteria bacterium]|nr:septum formation initiator family protein [Alphaproteobacteria bacterium]
MSLIESFKKHPKYLILPLLCLFLAGYFAYHALTGQRGLLRYLELKKEIAKDTAIAENIRAERLELQARVDSLSPENLDLDMLDEVGRRTLNLSEKDDYLIFEKDLKSDEKKIQSVVSSD